MTEESSETPEFIFLASMQMKTVLAYLFMHGLNILVTHVGCMGGVMWRRDPSPFSSKSQLGHSGKDSFR